MKNMLKIVGLGLIIAATSVSVYAKSLNQASWLPGTQTYQFGYNSIPNMPITGAPADTDYNRSAMLHDGTTYRLYFAKTGSNTQLYQFGWNGSSYQYGYDSIPNLTISGRPADANPADFAMLHDGTTYRLYMLSYDKTKVYQFGWNGSTYEYGYNSIPSINITGAPADTNKFRWAMLHDGVEYRMYFGKYGDSTKLYQFAWNGVSYAYGYNSIPVLTLDSVPSNSNTNVMNMLHDGSAFRFYYLAP